MTDIDNLKSLLKKRLTDKRYVHSLGVMETAEKLALHYGCDSNKAIIAGLLHDVTKKCTDAEHVELLVKYNVPDREELLSARKIWHSVTGAYYVKNELHIDDPEIFDAIRYHTTGRAGMSLLEKIIYVADFIEPNRDFDGVEKLRGLAFTDIDEAVYEGVKWCILENVEKNNYIYGDTFGLYNDCLKQKERNIHDNDK